VTSTSICFEVHTRNKDDCEREKFYVRAGDVVPVRSRCCWTSFAKIKLYVNARCRAVFGPMELRTHRGSQTVFPSWGKLKFLACHAHLLLTDAFNDG
jgi:hypothetical protein